MVVAVSRLDALMRATAVTAAEVKALAVCHRGARGLVQLRRAVDRDGYHVVGRIDMGWDTWKVGVEYDGPQHWTDPVQRARDIDRQAELEAQGWRIIRVSAEMLRARPTTIAVRVWKALRAAGAPLPPPNLNL